MFDWGIVGFSSRAKHSYFILSGETLPSTLLVFLFFFFFFKFVESTMRASVHLWQKYPCTCCTSWLFFHHTITVYTLRIKNYPHSSPSNTRWILRQRTKIYIFSCRLRREIFILMKFWLEQAKRQTIYLHCYRIKFIVEVENSCSRVQQNFMH